MDTKNGFYDFASSDLVCSSATIMATDQSYSNGGQSSTVLFSQSVIDCYSSYPDSGFVSQERIHSQQQVYDENYSQCTTLSNQQPIVHASGFLRHNDDLSQPFDQCSPNTNENMIETNVFQFLSQGSEYFQSSIIEECDPPYYIEGAHVEITKTVEANYPQNDSFFNQIDQLKSKQPELIEVFQKYVNENYCSYTKEEMIAKLVALKSKFPERNQSSCLMKEPKSYNNIIKSGKNIQFSIKNGVSLDSRIEKFRKIRKNFGRYRSLIDKLICNLENDQISSTRDLFYQNKRYFKSPSTVTRLLNDICCSIHVTRIDLKICSSQKSFVFGDLVLGCGADKIDCSLKSPTLIPNQFKELIICRSNARFILLIEKSSIFNNLISSGIGEKFSLIMITGCGYPDLKARCFVQKLWFELRLPIFALMDGDAYGIDIALAYKYGTLCSAFQNHQLIVPEIQWLGINGADIVEFRLQGTAYQASELRKFDSLQKRLDVCENMELHQQIMMMKDLGIKVELQSLLDYSSKFLLEYYLPYKLVYGKWNV